MPRLHFSRKAHLQFGRSRSAQQLLVNMSWMKVDRRAVGSGRSYFAAISSPFSHAGNFPVCPTMSVVISSHCEKLTKRLWQKHCDRGSREGGGWLAVCLPAP